MIKRKRKQPKPFLHGSKLLAVAEIISLPLIENFKSVNFREYVHYMSEELQAFLAQFPEQLRVPGGTFAICRMQAEACGQAIVTGVRQEQELVCIHPAQFLLLVQRFERGRGEQLSGDRKDLNACFLQCNGSGIQILNASRQAKGWDMDLDPLDHLYPFAVGDTFILPVANPSA